MCPSRSTRREPPAVTPGVRHAEPAGGDHHRAGLERSATLEFEPPSVAGGSQVRQPSVEPHVGPARPRVRHQAVADVARPVRGRKQLAGLRLERERNSELLLEEPPLRGERPAAQDVAEGVRRGVGDEPLRLDLRGEDVAAAAAADQDLAAAVPVRSSRTTRSPVAGREGRGQQPRGAGADDGHVHRYRGSLRPARRTPRGPRTRPISARDAGACPPSSCRAFP